MKLHVQKVHGFDLDSNMPVQFYPKQGSNNSFISSQWTEGFQMQNTEWKNYFKKPTKFLLNESQLYKLEIKKK